MHFDFGVWSDFWKKRSFDARMEHYGGCFALFCTKPPFII
jgi:hypothetical protein